MRLRPYQEDLCLSIYKGFMAGSNGIIAVAPTGGGKMATLTFMASKSKSKLLILFHVVELCNQCIEWLDRWGAEYNTIISGRERWDPNVKVTVAMMQTYIRRKDSIDHDFERIVIDEGHHAKAATYEDIFDLNKEAKRLAFTATPIRLDGTGLLDYKYFDQMVVGPSAMDLEAQGYLAPIKLFTHPADLDLTKVRTTAGDYNKKDIASVMEQATQGKMMGDAISYYSRYVPGKPALVCCSSIKQAEIVSESFSNAGIRAVAVSGKTKDRKEIVKDYTDGKIKVLTYCQVFGEGVDLPDATALFYQQPTKSLTKWRQGCGRVARKPYEDKVAYVFDQVGQAHVNFVGEAMGHPYRNVDWMQMMYDQQQRKAESKRSKTVKVFERCDECMDVYDVRLEKCPECGYNSVEARTKKAELKRIEGELKEFKEIEAVKSKALSELKTLKEMQTYAKIKGYKPGWAWYQFRKLIGNKKA